MSDRIRVYVAGPLSSSGVREDNVQRAIAAGLELIQRGYAPLIPHLSHFIDGCEKLGHATWLDVDMPWVDVADAVLRLPGESKGADMETARAKARGIPVFYNCYSLDQHFLSAKNVCFEKITCSLTGGDPRFYRILAEMAVLHSKKGADYGRGADVFANIRGSEKWGVPAWVGAMIRGTDKVKRLQSFVENGKLANEGVADSLLDLASYAIIALILFREKESAHAGNPGPGSDPASAAADAA